MPDQSTISYNNYLTGGGEMGELTRSFDWSKTPVGTPDTWPQSLLTTVSIILKSHFPMVLLWGEDLIQFYNDAYLPILDNTGKHPKALGQRSEECWAEVWPVMKPLIEKVLTTGESTWSENLLIPIYRNNKLEDVYWTFSYSKIIDETGKAAGMLAICNETTAQVQSFNELQDAKKKLEFTIEAAELGTWELNTKTNHVIGNHRLKSWFGVESQSEIYLKDVLGVIIEEDRPKVIEAIQKALKKGSDGNYSIVYTIQNPKDNIRRIVAAKGKAIFDSDGEPTRFSGILEDVTEDYQLQLRKDEFISVASHELKTPITSISASMQILQKFTKTENLPDKVSLFINKASNNLNKLVHLLDDLLNVTKIQQGQLALNKTRFNIVELIKDCCEHIHTSGTHEFVITGTDFLMIDADYRRIDQVMVNLLNNAIKYSPQAKKVEINIISNEDNITVSVRDFGIGINPDKLPHLFDRYYRVDAMGHQFSGLGLGLYISAEIISRHGGKIGADSTLGNGSTFWFTLPME